MAAGYAGPPARLELYERAVATLDAVECKGATMPYTSRNGMLRRQRAADETAGLPARASGGSAARPG
jgi:hypothetical protein